MPKLTVQEAAMTGFTDVISFKFGDDFKANTTAAPITKTYSVPAGTIIENAAYHLVTPFTGGSISNVTLDIGFGGEGSATIDDFIEAGDIFDGATYLKNNGAKLTGGAGARGHSFSTDDTIDIEFTPAGDGLANATAGEIVIKFTLLNMNKSDGVN